MFCQQFLVCEFANLKIPIIARNAGLVFRARQGKRVHKVTLGRRKYLANIIFHNGQYIDSKLLKSTLKIYAKFPYRCA